MNKVLFTIRHYILHEYRQKTLDVVDAIDRELHRMYTYNAQV